MPTAIRSADPWAIVYAHLPEDYIDPAETPPDNVNRGDEAHLAFLTLAYTLSGGREPESFWSAARRTYAADAELFTPRFLAYADPATLIPRLRHYGLARKLPSEATVWQRIGQALVMRAGGSARALLAAHNYDAEQIILMLGRSKTTFPVLSGPQTAPRWLYGLATVGAQPIRGAADLLTPVSPTVKRSLKRLNIAADHVPAALFGPLEMWRG